MKAPLLIIFLLLALFVGCEKRIERSEAPPFIDISSSSKEELIKVCEKNYTSAGGSLHDKELERRKNLINSHYHCAVEGSERALSDLANGVKGIMTYPLNQLEKEFVDCLTEEGIIDAHYVRSDNANNPCDRFYIYGYNSVVSQKVRDQDLKNCLAKTEVRTIFGAHHFFRPSLYSPKESWLSGK